MTDLKSMRHLREYMSVCVWVCSVQIYFPPSCLVHLSRHGAEVAMFAPDAPQMHVVNHHTGQPVEGETR